MELMISVIIGVLIIEIYAWLPRISQWLVDQAALRLPAEDQERYREEWHAYLDGLPNSAVKIVHALSYHRAIGRIDADIVEGKLNDIDDFFIEMSAMHHRITENMRHLKLERSKIGDFRDIVRKSIDKSLDAIPDSANTESAMQYRKALLGFRHAMIERIGCTADLHNRVTNLINIKIDRMSTNIDHVGALLTTIHEERAQIKKSWKFLSSSKATDRALERLNKRMYDLQTAVNVLGDSSDDESYVEEHNVYLNEMKNITALLQRVTDNLRNRGQ